MEKRVTPGVFPAVSGSDAGIALSAVAGASPFPSCSAASEGTPVEVRYLTLDEPATPEYALAVLRNIRVDQAEQSREFDRTIAEWIDAGGGTRDVKQLAANFNTTFAIHRPEYEWREVLEPMDEQTLGQLCDFISLHARRPRIRPGKLRGLNDREAGAFLTVRSLLHDAGAPASRIRPATPLAAYTLPYMHVFMGDLRRLAPGAMPDARFSTLPGHVKLGQALLIGGPAAFFGVLSGKLIIGAIGLATLVGALAIIWYPHRGGQHTLKLGRLQTFHDLAAWLASTDAMADAESPDASPARVTLHQP